MTTESMNQSHRSSPAFSTQGKPLPTPADLRTREIKPFTDQQLQEILHQAPTGSDPHVIRDVSNRPDLMIDIEALSTTPDSAPAEIALVFFDRDDPATRFLKFRYEPSPISSIRLGLTVDADTLKWWDDQGLTIAVQQGEPVAEVLDKISRDIAAHGCRGLRVWSRGNDYDTAILKLLYHRTGKPLPWNFSHVRDVRTWLEGCQFKSPRKNNHIALDDACNQALDVIEATAAIPNVTPSPN